MPTLESDDLVIDDTLSCHKSPAMRELLQRAGAETKHLPPYSPDMNPIEMAFSKVKAFFRPATPDCFEQLVLGLRHALNDSTPKIYSNFFRQANHVPISNGNTPINGKRN
ncbi:transposase [Coraliomargarita sp. W4R53]